MRLARLARSLIATTALLAFAGNALASESHRSEDHCRRGSGVYAADTSQPVTPAFLKKMREVGVRTIIRYFDHKNETFKNKTLTFEERMQIAEAGLPAPRRLPALGPAHLDLPRPYPRQGRCDPRPDARPRCRPAGRQRHLLRRRRAVVEQGRPRRHHPLLHRRPPHRRHARQPLPGRRLWQRPGLRHDPRRRPRRLLLARQRQGLAGLRHPPQVRPLGDAPAQSRASAATARSTSTSSRRARAYFGQFR